MITDADIVKVAKTIIMAFPSIEPYLHGRARWIAQTMRPIDLGDVKTVEFFTRTVKGLIRSLYNGDIIRGQFLDIMANLIQGQLTQAYHAGMMDAGLSAEEMTDAMRAELERFILAEYPHVDNLANDIINARTLGQALEPLIARASLWANRWNEVFNAAKLAVAAAFGLRMMWMLGPTEEHCETCYPLNGLVAFASEWEQAGLRPQSHSLMCGGWRCKCELIPTNARRNPRVLDRLMNVPRRA